MLLLGPLLLWLGTQHRVQLGGPPPVEEEAPLPPWILTGEPSGACHATDRRASHARARPLLYKRPMWVEAALPTTVHALRGLASRLVCKAVLIGSTSGVHLVL